MRKAEACAFQRILAIWVGYNILVPMAVAFVWRLDSVPDSDPVPVPFAVPVPVPDSDIGPHIYIFLLFLSLVLGGVAYFAAPWPRFQQWSGTVQHKAIQHIRNIGATQALIGTASLTLIFTFKEDAYSMSIAVAMLLWILGALVYFVAVIFQIKVETPEDPEKSELMPTCVI